MPNAHSADMRLRFETALNPRKTGKGKLAPYSDFFVELIEQDPDITLAELKSALEHAHGVCASISGVGLALRRLGYTYKKKPHCGRAPTRPCEESPDRPVSASYADDAGHAGTDCLH